MLSVLMTHAGYEVATASSAPEAIALAKENQFDLVISDIGMPEMSGWELIEFMNHGERDLAQIPVIAVTAHAMDHERRKAIEAGFLNFITKPLQPEKFVSQVIALLAVDMPELREHVEE